MQRHNNPSYAILRKYFRDNTRAEKTVTFNNHIHYGMCMSEWVLKEFGKLSALKDPILVEGLPGIGNVGKVAADFLIDELKAKKVVEFWSHSFPHSAFVNDKNLLELPSIELFHARVKGCSRDILLLVGDVQPIDERSCYSFCESLLSWLKQHNCEEVVTLAGIGLRAPPKKPQVFCTGTSVQYVKEFVKGTSINPKLYGIVGPIIGVSGVLIGLAKRERMDGIALLAETFGHPMYLGVKGARELIRVLSVKLRLKVNLKDLDKEITEVESELLRKSEEMSALQQKKLMSKFRGKFGKEVNYIQ